MPTIRNSPCAKLTTRTTPKISVSPRLMMVYAPPSNRPLMTSCMKISMMQPLVDARPRPGDGGPRVRRPARGAPRRSWRRMPARRLLVEYRLAEGEVAGRDRDQLAVLPLHHVEGRCVVLAVLAEVEGPAVAVWPPAPCRPAPRRGSCPCRWTWPWRWRRRRPWRPRSWSGCGPTADRSCRWTCRLPGTCPARRAGRIDRGLREVQVEHAVHVGAHRLGGVGQRIAAARADHDLGLEAAARAWLKNRMASFWYAVCSTTSPWRPSGAG